VFTPRKATYREVTKCRVCGQGPLRLMFSLGEQFVVDFVPAPDESLFKAPLKLARCEACGLVQLLHSVDRDRLYKKFWYRCLSSTQKMVAIVDGRIVHEELGKILSGGQDVKVPCVSDDGIISWRPILNRWKIKQQVYEILLTTGATIRASADHKWRRFGSGTLDQMQWQRRRGGNPGVHPEAVLAPTTELAVGDRIPVALRCGRPKELVDTNAIYDYDIGYMVGMFVAEGHWPGGEDHWNRQYRHGAFLSFHGSADDRHIAAVQETVTGKLHESASVRPLTDRNGKVMYISGPVAIGILSKFTMGFGALGKHLSQDVWSQSRVFIKGIIDGWLDGDASSKECNGRWQFNIGDNRALVEDMRLACLLLGYRMRGKRYPRPECGEYLFHGWIRKEPETARQQRSIGNLGYATIKSIRRLIAPHDTWDVEVGGNGLFMLGNGVVTHNSSTNESMREALHAIVSKACDAANVVTGDTVLDIGANDGQLLGWYNGNVKTVGIDPCGELIEEGLKKKRMDIGISYFFSMKVVQPHGPYKVITAIAMFYDLEDPVGFLKDCAQVLRKDGVMVVQMNYLASMLSNFAIDNVCHEHLAYFTMHTMKECAERAGLDVAGAETNDVNGGSFRVYLTHKGAALHGISSGDQVGLYAKSLTMLQNEKRLCLSMAETYSIFGDAVKAKFDALSKYLIREAEAGEKIYVCGASTRGTVLLQLLDLPDGVLCGVAERDASKFHLHMVGGTWPKIYPEDYVRENATQMLVLPWHFASSIYERELEWLKRGGKLILPLPEPLVMDYKGTGHKIREMMVEVTQ
jgi:NDP-4-keto-2,6-dideoxyhexose 3-C-methyltransferase